MPAPNESAATLLAHPAPQDHARALLLYGFRRMAAGGLHDAFAAQCFVAAFGRHFRRPLVLLRTLMAEIASRSARTLTVAPCCCPRATRDEVLFLDLFGAIDRPATLGALLFELVGTDALGGLPVTAAALHAAFADCGRPLA